MTEKDLHWVWEKQRFLSPDLKLTTGEQLTIISPGSYNKDRSGPDFELGQIRVNGMEFYGPIEIHIKSSDWLKHGHHNDPEYKNVILHVVAEHDMEISIDNYILPTLILPDLGMNFNNQRGQILCGAQVEVIDPVYIESMKSKSLQHKLNAKIQRFLDGRFAKEEVFYFLLASAFGMKVNQKPFEELAARASWEELSALNATARFQLILVRSGLLYEDRNRVSIGGHNWNFKGTRPGNYPSRRVGQFATLISGGIIEEFTLIEADFVKQFGQLINRHMLDEDTPLFSVSFRNHLIINAVVPYLFWFQLEENGMDVVEKLLMQLPPEKNECASVWKKSGIEVKNAFDSQSFLALDRYYCSQKKCLSCEVGNKVLNR